MDEIKEINKVFIKRCGVHKFAQSLYDEDMWGWEEAYDFAC